MVRIGIKPGDDVDAVNGARCESDDYNQIASENVIMKDEDKESILEQIFIYIISDIIWK